MITGEAANRMSCKVAVEKEFQEQGKLPCPESEIDAEVTRRIEAGEFPPPKQFEDHEIAVGAKKYIITAKKLGHVDMSNVFGSIYYYDLYEFENGNFRVHQYGLSEGLTREMSKKKVLRKYPELAREAGIAEVIDLR